MNKLQKVLIGLSSIFLFTILLSSCNKEQQIEKAIERLNQKMPRDAGGGITITRVEMNATALEYQCSLDEEEQPLSVLKEHATEFRNGIMKNLSNNLSNPAFKEIIETLVDTGRNLSYKIKGKEDSYYVNISPGELQKMLNGDAPTTVTPSLDEPKDSTKTD